MAPQRELGAPFKGLGFGFSGPLRANVVRACGLAPNLEVQKFKPQPSTRPRGFQN